jgi:hypothetical protein
VNAFSLYTANYAAYLTRPAPDGAGFVVLYNGRWTVAAGFYVSLLYFDWLPSSCRTLPPVIATLTPFNAMLPHDDAILPHVNATLTLLNTMPPLANAMSPAGNARQTHSNAIPTPDIAIPPHDNATLTHSNAVVPADNADSPDDHAMVTPFNAVLPHDNAARTSSIRSTPRRSLSSSFGNVWPSRPNAWSHLAPKIRHRNRFDSLVCIPTPFSTLAT